MEDSNALTKRADDNDKFSPLLSNLLEASEFDLAKAQRGIVYVDKAEGQDTQRALLNLWNKGVIILRGGVQFDARGVLFVCGGVFTGLDEVVAGMGRHHEQPITPDVLIGVGAEAEWVSHLAAFGRVAPLDEQSLARLVQMVHFAIKSGHA